jgi:ribonuclease HI
MNGLLQEQGWWKEKDLLKEYEQVASWLTLVDGETLLPEIYETLGMDILPPWTQANEEKVDIFLDGSYDKQSKRGGSGIFAKLPDRTIKIAQPIVNAHSSFEPELYSCWLALIAFEETKDLTFYTDSQSAIATIIQAKPNKELKTLRNSVLKKKILELIKKRKDEGKSIVFKFVYSHTADGSQRSIEQLIQNEIKKAKLLEQYGNDTRRIIEGNSEADQLAKEGRMKAEQLSSKYSNNDPEFILQIEKEDVPKDLIRRCYENILQRNKKTHWKRSAKHVDWRENPAIDHEASAIIMGNKERKLDKLKIFIFKASNDKLRTMKVGHRRAEQDKKSNYDNEWAKKRIEIYGDSENCPYGCNQVEDIDHLAKCPRSIEITNKVIKKLEDNNYGELTHYLSDSSTWKAKWFWCGFMPATIKEIVKNKINSKQDHEINKEIFEIQKILTEGLQEKWINRCKILFKKVQQYREEKKNRMVREGITIPTESTNNTVTRVPSITHQKRPRTKTKAKKSKLPPSKRRADIANKLTTSPPPTGSPSTPQPPITTKQETKIQFESDSEIEFDGSLLANRPQITRDQPKKTKPPDNPP